VIDINARLTWFSMVKRDMTLTLNMSVSVYVASVGCGILFVYWIAE
jgi:hypothetical protein